MEKLVIHKVNDVHIKVDCDAGVAMELSEYFTFYVPGYKYTPAYKNKVWDGRIRMFHAFTKRIYAGLRLHVEQFARERNYEIEYASDFSDESFSLVEAKEYKDSINLPSNLEERDYQIEAFAHAVRNKRSLLLSPTASGKSLIIYLLSRYYQYEKVLVVVPTTSLVHQMASDFVSYGADKSEVHTIYSGEEKETEAPFTVTTWQSVYKMPKEWFAQYRCVIGDEAHLFKAKSLSSIMEKLTDCPYKFGFTGTLDGTQTHRLVLEGLFGPVKKITTTAKLIEEKHLSEFKIKAILLKHSEEKCELVKKADYRQEIEFLVNDEERNKFIQNLALSLKGNTLILFHMVDKHGKYLYNRIKDKAPNQNVYFIHGGVEGEEREKIRKLVETDGSAIIVASYGTFSTGVNIKNLHNIIFASPSKSRIRNLQSIGRGLRKSNTKESAVLYDIGDDLSWKSKRNTTLLHFAERIKIYNEERFPYKIYTINLKG